MDALWARYRAGETAGAIATALGRPIATIYTVIYRRGGVAPAPRRRAAHALTVDEREMISRGLAAGDSCRTIAGGLGRAPSTISREIRRHGGATPYRAGDADYQAWHAARRPKPCRLALVAPLRAVVARKLAHDWSPQQISGWLMTAYPTEPAMHVSHETIYRTLFSRRGARCATN